MAQHEIARLVPRHLQIMDLMLAGNTHKEIAQALEMSPQAISLITKAPLFQQELSRRRAGIEKRADAELASVPARAKRVLEESAEAAAHVQIGLLQSVDPKVQLAASKEILDRVFGDEKRAGAQVVVLEVEQLNLLQVALRESAGTERSSEPLFAEEPAASAAPQSEPANVEQPQS